MTVEYLDLSIRTAQFLGAPVDKIITGIVKSNNPAAFAGQAVRQASEDGTGHAMEGLKAGFVYYLMARAASSRTARSPPLRRGFTLRTG